MKKIAQLFAFAFLFGAAYNSSYAQVCNVYVSPLDTAICPGDTVCIEAIASITAGGQSFNFDAGSLPPGWSTGGGSAWSQPCGTGIDGTPYYWASTAGTNAPQITTAAFDVSCGGVIQFDMAYSIQSDPSPCEGPDQADEGISLQYSISGGPWIDIIYYQPDGVELPSNPGTTNSVVNAGQSTPYTTWSTFNVPIPPGAMSTSTAFRWYQENSSGPDYDNWGLDNINVNGGPCNSATVDWTNGLSNTNTFCATPSTDTSFVALVYDTLGVFQCSSDTITISIVPNDMTYTLQDSAFLACPNSTVAVPINNATASQLPISYDWSNGSQDSLVTLSSGANPHDTIVYDVTLTDGCGYTSQDSVILIVNQILTIDSLIQNPASACFNDGLAVAYIDPNNLTLAPGSQPLYNWDDQANWDNPGSGSNLNGTAWGNIPSGWYHFTVTDDVCTAHDSIFVDIENMPVAQINPSITSGCAPLSVTFENASQNASTFIWDLGSGTFLVNDMNAQSEVYNQSAVVMLIAESSPNCSDTAYVNIDVIACGCTDPLADNYNPGAVQDDGSCTYPHPTAEVPNIFTPNGDDINDVFAIETTNASKVELVITNRWGNVMFESSVLNPIWDGKTPGGAEAQEGTYFYKYVITGVNGVNEISGHGFVQLVRK